MENKELSYHYPALKRTEDGEWVSAGDIIGDVLPDGRIENTPYKFTKTEIRGGKAVTSHTVLEKLPTGDLMNPASGERFKRTKKRTGWWSKRSQTFVPNSYMETDG